MSIQLEMRAGAIAVIARYWRVQLTAGRHADYEAFAETQSAPMFRALPGCIGVLFLGQGAERTVLSIWRDEASTAALAANPTYRAVSTRLLESGILEAVDPIQVEVVGSGSFLA